MIYNIRFYLFHLIIIALCTGLYLVKPSPTIASFVFDAYIIFGFVFIYVKGFRLFFGRSIHIPLLFVLLSCFIYLHYRYFSGVVFQQVFEFLRSFRYILYAFIYFFVAHNYSKIRVFNEPALDDYVSSVLAQFFKIFCVVLLLVYVTTFLFSGSRPSLYSENNFEVPALIILLVIAGGNLSRAWNVVTGMIAILSLSRSGLLAYLYASYLHLENSSYRLLRFFGVTIVAITAIYYLFSVREIVSFEDIDRYKFLIIFINSYDELSLVNILIGHGLASELPVYTCMSMSYYSELIHVNPAYCNSVIFHSFFMRVFYDTGLVGTFLLLFIWFFALIKIFDNKQALTIFGVLGIASLSVSGFGNSIILWPLFVHLYYLFYVRIRIIPIKI
jgi:hypothetical protein